MPDRPLFSYFISHHTSPITKHSEIWHQPLPLSRKFSNNSGQSTIDHGVYFNAVRVFLEKSGCEMISQVFSQRFKKSVKPTDIREIKICLEKHGEFYHPARVDTFTGHQNISFVLNVAVSEAGIRSINTEYHHLKKLGDEFSPSFLPRVYGYGQVRSVGNRRIHMFLGQWFEGYNEFHVSKDPLDNKYKILVWNDSKSRLFLSPQQSAEIYRQMARILTYYYNVESFEQISAWHHAAGDFVIRIDTAGIDTKIITVRSYAPLFSNLADLKNSHNDPELILQALLIFFLNLSIRMRLDRLDGVGDVIWADNLAVQSTLAGFLEGLALKPRISLLPGSNDQCFSYYLAVCTKEDLQDLSKAVISTFHQQAPEVPVIKQHLNEHVEALSQAIDGMFNK
ncbi:MAG: hypothetical protein KJO34_04890 [Deltaproteobacteria bacterium]|nr:hypothetical protein [Deltaproteobacteria bacterium]